MSEEIKYGRKRRGIRRELSKKIESWLMSIDDIDVQAAARKDCIVTGGAIASMLLGEAINDYDVYFRTKETTKLIAEYYVAKFKKKNSEIKVGNNVHPVEMYVEEEDTVNIKGIIEERICIYIKSAGIATEDSEDPEAEPEYNYFESMGEDAAIDYVEQQLKDREEEDKGERFRPVFLSQNAITLSHSIQLITRFYGEPKKIHDNYDFVHAKCYYDHYKEKLKLPGKALEALMSRSLIYEGSLYPIASIFRMKKFLERGWRITAGEQLKIIWQISEIDLTHMPTLRDQLTGVDMAYLYQIIQILHKNKDNGDKINSTYVAQIIDKVFN